MGAIFLFSHWEINILKLNSKGKNNIKIIINHWLEFNK